MSDFVKKYLPITVDEVKIVTEKAMLVPVNGTDHWLPKSQCDNLMDVGSSGELLITEWIGGQKGLFELEQRKTTDVGPSDPPRVPDDGIPF